MKGVAGSRMAMRFTRATHPKGEDKEAHCRPLESVHQEQACALCDKAYIRTPLLCYTHSAKALFLLALELGRGPLQAWAAPSSNT